MIKHDDRIANLIPSGLHRNAINSDQAEFKASGLPTGVVRHNSGGILNRKPFRATIMLQGKQKHLGYFELSEEAGQAYQEALRKATT